MPLNGFFHCEFCPRGKPVDPAAAVSTQSSARRSQTPSRVQLFCDNGRRCGWKVSFGQQKGIFYLPQAKNVYGLSHTGHRMRTEGAERQQLNSIRNVPEVVLDRLTMLVKRRLDAHAIREVHITMHSAMHAN